jgi:hypothetical protein
MEAEQGRRRKRNLKPSITGDKEDQYILNIHSLGR